MEKSCKKLSWLNLVACGAILVGIIFGVLAGLEVNRLFENNYIGMVVMVAVAIAGLVLIIVNIVAFFSMRNGDVKSSVLSIGRSSGIQSIAPYIAGILAIIGLFVSSQIAGKEVSAFGLGAVAVGMAIVAFAQGFNTKGLRGYRKDKESYLFICVTAWITAGALLIFGVIATISMLQMPGIEGTHVVGYLETFAVFFVLADVISYVALALICGVMHKHAPKVTMADADASKLDQMADNIAKMAANSQPAQPANNKVDNVEEIRKYKQLLDEGIISQAEFDAKKKELL